MNKIATIISLLIVGHGQCAWVRAEPTYLQRLINYNTSAPRDVFANPRARCNFIFDGRVFLSALLNSQEVQYEPTIGTLKMIIDNKLALVLFEKYNQETHAVEGIFYESYGRSGPVNGRCIY
jgi:hypothetical protein